MSEATKTLGNYAKTLLAMLKGDETEALALHNERRAKSAIKKQLSNLEDRKTTLQEELENAEEELKKAKYPTFKLGESSNYCGDVKKAQAIVDDKKDQLEDIDNSVKYFEDLKKELGL